MSGPMLLALGLWLLLTADFSWINILLGGIGVYLLIRSAKDRPTMAIWGATKTMASGHRRCPGCTSGNRAAFAPARERIQALEAVEAGG
mgnify:CR=1 FL=1